MSCSESFIRATFSFLFSAVALLPPEVYLLQLQQVHIQREKRVHNGWMPSEGGGEPAEAQSGILVWSLVTPTYTSAIFHCLC